MLADWKRIEVFLSLTQNIVTKLSKIWVRDPGSRIRDPEKTYPGSRILWFTSMVGIYFYFRFQ